MQEQEHSPSFDLMHVLRAGHGAFDMDGFDLIRGSGCSSTSVNYTNAGYCKVTNECETKTCL